MTDIKKSFLSALQDTQLSFEEAKKLKQQREIKRTQFFSLKDEGTYKVRILPLAPSFNAEGEMLPMDRKGYEYPLRSMVLKIEDYKNTDNNGNPKHIYASVCNAKHAFPELENDLIDTYVSVALEKYSNDKDLCEKLKETTYTGGLRYDYKRCMYVYDIEDMSKGMQILQLSNSQFRSLEEAKIQLWSELIDNAEEDEIVQCPISSPFDAYHVNITKSKNGKKVEYTFSVGRKKLGQLTDEQFSELETTPRLPEALYRYSRYHLEAAMTYLQQADERFEIHASEDPRVVEVYEQISALLPADDHSHFSIGASENNGGNTLQSLWDMYNALVEQDLDDESAEGQELKGAIREFISDNDLDVKIKRGMSIEDLLTKIEEISSPIASDEEDDAEEDERPTRSRRKAAPKQEPEDEEVEEEELDNEDDEEEEEEDDFDEDSESEDDEEEDEEESPKSPRTIRRRRQSRERDDDTNEPAVRSRRSSRPVRRRG